ncbi:acylneuraminate cytidylyltransferase family protein [Schleiferiaceae bacterium]|nr:acylneuraminate cytidylyltransferase family protein [Schleiferiaceae bacterium]
MKYIGIIPARGGSKGVPGKNKKLLNGKPLISYTIESALKAGVLDDIFVSSDDEEILEIASDYDGVTCIVRPNEISGDLSTTEEVLIHVIKQMGLDKGQDNYAVVTLEPTSPFRRPSTLVRALDLFRFHSYLYSVVSVVEDFSVYYTNNREMLTPIFADLPRRRQDRDPILQEKSLIYVTRLEDLMNKSLVLGKKAVPLIVENQEALDINTISDFSYVEFIMTLKK